MFRIAPVCHIQGETPITQPGAKSFPAIPQATDLASALAAINALRLAVNTLRNAGGGSNSKGSGNHPSSSKLKQPSTPQWIQATRITEKVKIVNPTDPEQFVIIDRINALTMRNTITGEQWVWTR